MSGASMALSYDDQAVQAAFAALLAVVDDLAPTMANIGAALESNVQLRFEAGAGPGGVAWTPSQRALGEGGKTLMYTRRLFKSMTHVYGADFAEVGTNTAYAAIHQFGGTITRHAHSKQVFFKRDKDGAVGNLFVRPADSDFAQWAEVGEYTVTMLARPFLGFDQADEDEVMSILRARIEEAMAP